MGILASVNARSAGVRGYFAARPLADRVPLMHWIADRKRENDNHGKILRDCNSRKIPEYEKRVFHGELIRDLVNEVQ